MRAFDPPVDELVVTEGCATWLRQRGPRPAAGPGRGTDDGPGQVPDFTGVSPAFTVAGTAPEFHRLPFEPPPPKRGFVGGTLVDAPLGAAPRDCQFGRGELIGESMTSNHSRLVALLAAVAAA